MEQAAVAWSPTSEILKKVYLQLSTKHLHSVITCIPDRMTLLLYCTIYKWKHLLKDDAYKNIIIESLQYLATNNRVRLNGYVIISNHVHLIWQPERELYTTIQSAFMKFTATTIKAKLKSYSPEILNELLVNKYDRQYQIWKREPLIVELFTPVTLEQKLEYIHANPVRVGLCHYPEE